MARKFLGKVARSPEPSGTSFSSHFPLAQNARVCFLGSEIAISGRLFITTASFLKNFLTEARKGRKVRSSNLCELRALLWLSSLAGKIWRSSYECQENFILPHHFLFFRLTSVSIRSLAKCHNLRENESFAAPVSITLVSTCESLFLDARIF